jgi:hypothetical protein
LISEQTKANAIAFDVKFFAFSHKKAPLQSRGAFGGVLFESVDLIGGIVFAKLEVKARHGLQRATSHLVGVLTDRSAAVDARGGSGRIGNSGP